MPEISRFFGIIIYRVTAFKIIKPFVLQVWFDDKTEQLIEFWPVLAGDLYRPLRDPDFFQQVRIDPEVHTLVWPNGADFDPETLHNWPEYAKVLAARAEAWEMVSA